MKKVVYLVWLLISLTTLAACQKKPVPDNNGDKEKIDLARLYDLWKYDGYDWVEFTADGNLKKVQQTVVGETRYLFRFSFSYSFGESGAIRYGTSYVNEEYYSFKTDVDRPTGKPLFISVDPVNMQLTTNILDGESQTFGINACSDAGLVLLLPLNRESISGSPLYERHSFSPVTPNSLSFEATALGRNDRDFPAYSERFLNEMTHSLAAESGEKWTDEELDALRSELTEAFCKLF